MERSEIPALKTVTLTRLLFQYLQAQLLYVMTGHKDEKSLVTFLKFFTKKHRKPGTGLFLRFVVPEQNQAQACVYVSLYQNKTRHRPVSMFRCTRTKPGTGLCLRFVVPEQNQAQACVYVSLYQNKARYRPVSTFRCTRTKPGTGLCLRFVIPEQNQVQACV